MRSVRCDVCGTKALMAASQCPKCSHPLAVRDGFGELLPLAHCPTCDSDYPAHQGACRWCGTTPAKPQVGPKLWKGVGIGAFVSMGIGAWLVRGEEPAKKPMLLASTADSTPAASVAESAGTSQQTRSSPDTLIVDTTQRPDSTTVVAVDSLSRGLATTDTVSMESAGVIADGAQVVASATESIAADTTATSESAPARVDSARLREPWLPPPSVIRRPPPPVSASPSMTTAAPTTETPPPVSAPTAVATAPTPVPRSTASTERITRRSTTRVAAPPRTGTPTAPAATSATSRAKPKLTAKAVAKAPPKRTTTRVATTNPRTTTTRKAAPAPSRVTASAKPPLARPRSSSRWVNSIARGWTVVRATANGRARIIGSVGPDTRVQLGETRGGFRRIRARGLAGWVDSRAYFVAAPAPRRSGRLASQ